MKTFRKIFAAIAILFLLLPAVSRADSATSSDNNDSTKKDGATFTARVIEVMQVQEKTREDGSKYKQQDLKLLGLDGQYEDKKIDYFGVSEIEVANANFYAVGDRVYVDAFSDDSGKTTFYVVDFVRTGYIFILTAIFVFVVIVIGRWKGFSALLGLVISFFVIIKFMLPQILAGHDPFIISLIGGLLILATIIYLSEGFKRKSHIAILSVLASLLVTLILSVIFVSLTKLSGMAQEETSFLIGAGTAQINFQGLLLAGFIIGAIGILDDIIIGQIEAVEQIREANPALESKKVFSLAYKVGKSHLGAIINTLFLTYAGASLPLLLLFILNHDSVTFSRLINTEVVSTEIVRTLVGSVGIILSMPIATFLAAMKFNVFKRKTK
ncbi:MAG: YibE/F family protein [Candidatus Falkowbacteria bacterium]